jgi:ribonuclease P protein component
MISSAHRFHGHNSLNFVYKNGQTVRGPLFAIKYIENSRRRTYRAAVVVSRKVNKSAVARNRIRRRLYAIVRELDPEIAAPYDIVISVFHDSLLEEAPKNLSHQLKRQLEQAGIIKP